LSSSFGIGSFAAIELALLLGPVVKGFNAEARIEKERTDDIRRAEAGFVSGEVVPSIAGLVDTIGELLPPRVPQPQLVRRAALIVGVRADDLSEALAPDDLPDSRVVIGDALSRGSITTQLNAVITASALPPSVRKAETRLVSAWSWLAYVCVAAQLAGAVSFINGLTSSEFLPHGAVVIGRFALGVFGAATLAALFIVRRGEQTLARAIRRGKDAGGQNA